MSIDLSEDEIQRYSRHILLAELGGTGQMAIKNASVLVVGAGGLGSPVALYLAAAGVGRLGLVDDDVVELSNLQRQVLHATGAVGHKKVASARERLNALNPEIVVEAWDTRLDTASVEELVSRYDLVCDGCDNFETRYLVNAACVRQGKTLVSAAVQRFGGQLSTFRPQLGGPCYACLYPPHDGEDTASPTCGDAGVLGAVTGVVGTLQATEALKEITGIGTSMAGRLLMWDALSMRFSELTLAADPACPVCGAAGVCL